MNKKACNMIENGSFHEITQEKFSVHEFTQKVYYTFHASRMEVISLIDADFFSFSRIHTCSWFHGFMVSWFSKGWTRLDRFIKGGWTSRFLENEGPGKKGDRDYKGTRAFFR